MIVELDQHRGADAGDQRTGCIAIIDLGSAAPGNAGDQMIDRNQIVWVRATKAEAA
jgi:hypothetical protein